MPLEGIAPQVFEAIYQRQQGEILWVTVLWMIAQLNGYWVGGTSPPLPSVFQITYAEPVTSFASCMQQPPSMRLAYIREY